MRSGDGFFPPVLSSSRRIFLLLFPYLFFSSPEYFEFFALFVHICCVSPQNTPERVKLYRHKAATPSPPPLIVNNSFIFVKQHKLLSFRCFHFILFLPPPPPHFDPHQTGMKMGFFFSSVSLRLFIFRDYSMGEGERVSQPDENNFIFPIFFMPLSLILCHDSGNLFHRRNNDSPSPILQVSPRCKH